jgi:hypothetical protein
MPELTKHEQEELERLKHKTEISTLTPAEIQLMIKAKDLPTEIRLAMAGNMVDFFNRDGRDKLMRAFLEGVMTEQEYLAWKQKGVEEGDFSTILGAYYAKADGFVPDGVPLVVVTTSECIIFKLRDELAIRFGLNIIDLDEANAQMEEELKKQEEKG